MRACTFFGHRDCFELDREKLCQAIEELIHQGVDTFYVGNQGQFDGAVHSCLKQLRLAYPHIRFSVVLAYLPTEKRELEDLSDTIYPEIEGSPKFAIDRRNRWMLQQAEYVICYVCHITGGAYKFAKLAKRQGKKVINLGNAEIEL